MKQFIIKNIIQIAIVALLLTLIFEKCSRKAIEYRNTISIKRDTVWVHNNNYVVTEPQIIETIIDTIETKTIEYLPSEDYVELRAQYLKLKDDYLNKNIFKDSITIDSLGTLALTDTVTKNKITGRSYAYNFTYPLITNTITMPYKPKNQVYIGGMISGNKDNFINQVDAGLLFKNKKDQIFGIKSGIDTKGQWNVGLQSYWKIKF